MIENKTIICEDSLLRWEQNRNGVDFGPVNKKAIDLLLVPCYEDFFKTINKGMKGKISFVKFWHKECNNFTENIFNTIKTYLEKNNIFTSKNERALFKLIDEIVLKSRGNAGEIPVNQMVLAGDIPYCTNECIPVDPNAESYFDITSKERNTGFLFDIQVKNYDEYLVGRDIFDKCSTIILRRIDGKNPRVKKIKLNNKEKEIYSTTPHQMIFSFTDVCDKRILDEYSTNTIFYGPDKIDNYFKESNREYIFKNILDNIKEFKKLYKKFK